MVEIFPSLSFFFVVFSFFRPVAIFFFALFIFVWFFFSVLSCVTSFVRPDCASVRPLSTSFIFSGSASSSIPIDFSFSRSTFNCVCIEVSDVLNSAGALSPSVSICCCIAASCVSSFVREVCNVSNWDFVVFRVEIVVWSFVLLAEMVAIPDFNCFSLSARVFFCSSIFVIFSSIAFRPSLILSVAELSFVSPLAILSAASCFWESSSLLPSSNFFSPLSSFFSASESLPSMASCTFSFILSILSCWIMTSIFFSMPPDSLTEATPSTLSTSGIMSFSTFFVTSVLSRPS